MDTNILYNDSSDTLYILVDKLGEGSFATVWLSLEILKFTYYIKIKRPFEINLRALKIHFDDSYDEGILETKINEILVYNGKKSNLINYPLSHFFYNEIHVIVVYELALGSLYDILKKFDRKLDIKYVEKMIPQMIDSVKYIHKCGYTHTDVKPENYLLMGMTQKQSDIVAWTKKYNLVEKFKKMSNIKKIDSDELISQVHTPIYKFLKELSNKFELKENILDSDEESSCSNSSSSKSTDDEFDEFDENDNFDQFDYDSDYDTNCSSYNSEEGEYEEIIDEFHIKEILEILSIRDKQIEKSLEESKTLNQTGGDTDKIKLELLKYLENPIVKLMDFGLIEKHGSRNHTINTRYYRSPEIVLGIKYNESTDIWSLGCSIYELITGKIMIDVDKNPLSEKYDKELVNMKMLIEKLGDINYNSIMKLISKSPRKNKIINRNKTLKFFNEIIYKSWKEDIENTIGKDYKNYNLIIKTIDNMLRINNNERCY